MSTKNESKINRLLSMVPRGTVILTSWLRSNDYSHELIKRYKVSGWLESIGHGAVIIANDKIDYLGALYALQSQGNLNVHIGGRSAFTLLGKSHYLELAPVNIILFGSRTTKLPTWFTQYNWPIHISYHSTEFLPAELGLVELPVKEFMIKISDEIRALMECLYLVPQHQDIIECYELMEGMNNIHPKKIQLLLEKCTSVKVKRLFLYLAEKAGHEWFNYLDLSKINLGTGKRSIIPHGAFNPKYQITVPEQWRTYDK